MSKHCQMNLKLRIQDKKNGIINFLLKQMRIRWENIEKTLTPIIYRLYISKLYIIWNIRYT